MGNLKKIWYRYFVRTGIIYLLIVCVLWLVSLYFVYYFKDYFLNIYYVLLFFFVVFFVSFVFIRFFTNRFNEYMNEYYDLTVWQEKNAIYEIEVLNKNGDANVRRTSNIINISAHVQDYKIIKIYSSDSGMDFQNLNFKSYIVHNGKKLDNLEYETIDNSPNIKLVKIKFPEKINLHEEITHSYSFYWKGLFPKDEEWFEGTDSSNLVTYILISDRPVNNLKISEMNRENKVIKTYAKNIQQKKVDGKHKYVLSYSKRYKYNKIKISWKFRNSNESACFSN